MASIHSIRTDWSTERNGWIVTLFIDGGPGEVVIKRRTFADLTSAAEFVGRASEHLKEG